MDNTVKVLLVDDHKIFLEGLKLLLSEEKNLEVIGQAENGREMLDFVSKTLPDIVVMDINMPVMNGLGAAEIALKEHPDLKILILSSNDEDDYINNALSNGVKGFVEKNYSHEDLVMAINTVISGQVYFSQTMLQRMIDSLKVKEKEVKTPESFFTKRELEIIERICRGETNKEIAANLDINVRTVETHKANIIEKAGVKNTLNLVIYAVKSGIVKMG